MRTTFLLALLAPIPVLPAQGQLYSPADAATADANSENTIPFRYTSGRYQQAHGDLLGPARSFTALAVRRDGRVGPLPSATARTLDLEVLCYHATTGRPSTTFQTNYATAPVTVQQRRMVALPDWTANLGNPAPWHALPFDVPFAYSGTQPFGWELRIRGSTANGAYFADSYESSGSYGATTTTGTGCIATGRSARMTFNPLTSTNRAANAVQFLWSLDQGPASAPSSFLFGSGPASLPVPGLCTNLYVDGIFLTVNATTNAAGTAFLSSLSVPYQPAFAGVPLHGQGASVDAGQSGLPIAMTNGASVTIAPMPPLLAIFRVYASDVAATTGTTDPSANYGLAVRVTH